jgi:hypothetical protein
MFLFFTDSAEDETCQLSVIRTSPSNKGAAMQRYCWPYLTLFLCIVFNFPVLAAEQSAGGSYSYDSSEGTLSFYFTTSTFVCDGPPVNWTLNATNVTIEGTILSWVEEDEGEIDIMTWQRRTGTSGLVGIWYRDHNGTEETLTFDSTTFNFVGPDSAVCSATFGTGSHSAAGTYSYDSSLTESNFSLIITSSDFVDECAGPGSEHQTFFVSPVSETTMIWTEPNENYTMIWTRSTGTAGDIVGTWVYDDQGNIFTLTLDQSGNATVYGVIGHCDDMNTEVEAYLWSNYSNDEYAIQIEVYDPDNDFVSVTVEGDEIQSPIILNHYPEDNLWASWGSDGTELVSFGATHPVATPEQPLSYTLTFTDGGSNYFTRQFPVSNFIEHVATPVSPESGTTLGMLQRIEWERHPDIADNIMYVAIYNSSGERIWREKDITENFVEYDGPTLADVSYKYRLKVLDDEGNSSKIKVPFTIAFIKGDLDASSSLDISDAILALKILSGEDIGTIPSGAFLDGDSQIGLNEALYIINSVSNDQ